MPVVIPNFARFNNRESSLSAAKYCTTGFLETSDSVLAKFTSGSSKICVTPAPDIIPFVKAPSFLNAEIISRDLKIPTPPIRYVPIFKPVPIRVSGALIAPLSGSTTSEVVLSPKNLTIAFLRFFAISFAEKSYSVSPANLKARLTGRSLANLNGASKTFVLTRFKSLYVDNNLATVSSEGSKDSTIEGSSSCFFSALSVSAASESTFSNAEPWDNC